MTARSLAFGAVLVGVAACASGYPQALTQCSSVTVAADAADTGCVVSFNQCPANGTGTITCGPRNGGLFVCECAYKANDGVSSAQGQGGFPAEPNFCSRPEDGLRALAQECP
jgi:hypothetical protein